MHCSAALHCVLVLAKSAAHSVCQSSSVASAYILARLCRFRHASHEERRARIADVDLRCGSGAPKGVGFLVAVVVVITSPLDMYEQFLLHIDVRSGEMGSGGKGGREAQILDRVAVRRLLFLVS